MAGEPVFYLAPLIRTEGSKQMNLSLNRTDSQRTNLRLLSEGEGGGKEEGEGVGGEGGGGKGGEGGRGRTDWEFGISRCKLLYIGLINKKILPYDIGNYIQYPIVNHKSKEYFKNACVYVYI